MKLESRMVLRPIGAVFLGNERITYKELFGQCLHKSEGSHSSAKSAALHVGNIFCSCLCFSIRD